MFKKLKEIYSRPRPFEFYTASELWADEHTSKQMLAFHLNGEIDVSSRKFVFIDKSVEWISTRFNVGAETKIIDFGCGPGLYTTRLARKRAAVTGIDFSASSIRYAKRVASLEGLQIKYLNQNYLDFATEERFDLALLIMCDFCALSPEQRKSMLSTFHATLKPGGSVLLDVYSLKAFEQRKEVSICEPNLLNGFWSPEEYYGFLNTFKYDAEKVVLDKYTIVTAERTREIYNWLQYFSPVSLQEEFTACGFVIDSFYSDVAGLPFEPESNEFAVVASKASC